MTSTTVQHFLDSLAQGLHRDNLPALATQCHDLAGTTHGEEVVPFTLLYLAFAELIRLWEGQMLSADGVGEIQTRLTEDAKQAVRDPSLENLQRLSHTVLWAVDKQTSERRRNPR